MKKSFMNIKHFVDSNVRQRIDRAANNNNDFFGDDLLLVERQFDDMRLICAEAEKRISALLQSLNTSQTIGAYTQNVQASLNNLSNLTTTTTTATTTASTTSDSNGELVNSQCSKQGATCTQLHSTAYNKFDESSTVGNTVVHSQSSCVHASDGIAETTELRNNDIRRHKKLPIVGFLKFLSKSCHKLRPDSLLATTLTHCSLLQAQLTKLYLSYEQTIESQCLKPIQQILEIDAPNVIKLRKLFIKSHNDLESVKTKYNGACQKQQQQQLLLQASHFTSTSYTIAQSSAHQANINKLDQLKKELDEAVTRFEQARDTYATELYAFVCRETELVNLFMKFYQSQADYQQQVAQVIQSSLPPLSITLATTPRKVVFGTPLDEHLRCTGRSVSLVIELCVHLLYSNGLEEEGLFRVPGSSAKIKKLKNAINAWFVTLASQSELEIADQSQQSFNRSNAPELALYNLLKNIVGTQHSHQATQVGGNDIMQAPNSSSSTQASGTLTVRNDHPSLTFMAPTTTPNPSSAQDTRQLQLVFDVHTIAGLLKLYLRELPEPLFTYSLYEQWIDATVKTLNSDNQLASLERVVEQLPKANYDSLKLLIRFLHLLTNHRKTNRMTETNLAITMAPSLIWTRPSAVSPQQQNKLGDPINIVNGDQQETEMQALNMQMSSVGLSASLHALVIENLIKHAEELFKGPVQFTLPGVNDISSETKGHQQVDRPVSSRQERTMKSTSPTGLSTASSSSFSSSASAVSTTSKRHSRKGGSIDGLLDATTNQVTSNVTSSTATISNTDISGRPLSVQIQREHSQGQQQPPPVPPAPIARSHSRQASDSSSQTRSSAYHNKPPAPPLPPPCTLKRQPNLKATSVQAEQFKQRGRRQLSGSQDSSESSTVGNASATTAQSATRSSIGATISGSLRGTGSIPSTVNVVPSSGINSARPTVPPPCRPPSKVNDYDEQQQQVPAAAAQLLKSQESSKKGEQEESENNNFQCDSKSSNSRASSGNLRGEFEEINAVDVDEIDLSVPISPVVSLEDSFSASDDSSFDNNCRSLEHSWTECDLVDGQQDQADAKITVENVVTTCKVNEKSGSKANTTTATADNMPCAAVKPAPRLQRRRAEELDEQQSTREQGHDIDEDKLSAPPVKPPRSISPKVTQSTPL